MIRDPDAPTEAKAEVDAGRLRLLPDRWLHAARRRALLWRLARRDTASSVLFVCIGNIYRSPFAAAAFHAALPAPFRASIRAQSAGVTGPDRPTPAEAVRAARLHGIDLASHRSRLVTGQIIRDADLIVVMDPSLRRMICGRFGRKRRDVILMGDLDPQPIQTREIADPWGGDRELLEGSYARLARCARELANAVMGVRGGY